MSEWLGAAFLVVSLAAGVAASGHALLYKRRPRAAFGWIAVCLTFPLAGALLYLGFGVNRTRRRARKLREEEAAEASALASAGAAAAAGEAAPVAPGLLELGRRVGDQPLLEGNAVEPLFGGEQAYPPMLEAIEAAESRVLLATYIHDTDDTGRDFVEALGRAVARGVDVRVLLDGVGELYSFPRARWLLRRRGVPFRRFLPPRLVPPSFSINLRNHRKILVVDDVAGFTGGMNVSDRHWTNPPRRRRPVADVHFAVRGPIVGALAAHFEEDWAFAGGTAAEHRRTRIPAVGTSRCRVVADGPDEPLDRLLLMMVGAVGLARERVWIMTPYFVPPRELLGSLQAAALRGVDVSILLPEHNNLFYVHRATRHMLWELLERGVRIHYQPGPFVHSKLLLIDDAYAQVGSANIDPRSLRLNFELNLEVHDRTLVTRLAEHFEAARRASHEVTLEEVDGRPIPTRVLDGICWLFSPYL